MAIDALIQRPLRSSREEVKEKLLHRTAVVGVVGMGYVGLPLAVEKAKIGFSVLAFDRNDERTNAINRGESYVGDVRSADLSAVVLSGKIVATSDVTRLRECDVIVICVPTPLTRNRDPDISHIRAVTEQIAAQLRPGQLISLESTTFPGTTEEVVVPMLSSGGLIAGQDFFVAFSPERVDPGNRRYSTRNTNKIVGGLTSACLEVATLFYQQTIVDVVTVSSPRVAEMTKVFENVFRSVNIALVNELALLCDKMDISVWEVVDAAATKPFGIMRFEPGPGVGGHCIPIDPFYLAWKAKQYDFNTRFIELAGEINKSMPYFVRDKLTRALNRRQRSLKSAKIVFIGVSYKRDIADWRESPAMKLLELLENEGADMVYHDPYVPTLSDASGRIRVSADLTAELLSGCDCAVILADHSNTDWQFIVDTAPLVLDTRNATADVAGTATIVRL
jgi:UDP-N-acetyl-D-glucosamine dehydrogenase